MARTRVLWASLAAGATAMTALLTAAHAIAPYLASDPAPLAGVARVEDAIKSVTAAFQNEGNKTRAIVVKGQIIGMWARCRDAVKAHDLATAQDRAVQIADLQLDYVMLTGLTYPLQPCP